MPHTDTLIWEIEQYQILPGYLASAYGHALPFAEIILGALLVLGVILKISASLSGLLTLSFVIAKATALVKGLDIDICNCFGPAVPLLSVYSLAIDFLLLALAIQLSFNESKFLSLNAFLKNRRN